jgi:hypothetical protein
MRIFLLRLLISWWMIAFITSLIPMIYLMQGWKIGMECYKDFVKMLWNGEA